MGFHFVEMHIESATGLSHLIQCSIPHREAATRKNECKNDIFQVRAALHQLRNVNCEGCDRHTLTQRKTLSLCYSPFHSFAIFYVGTINGFQYQRFWHSHPISTFCFFQNIAMAFRRRIAIFHSKRVTTLFPFQLSK